MAEGSQMKTFLHMRARRELFSLADPDVGDPEEQKLIQTLDEIRENLANNRQIMDALNIPCVVVIGDQSTGKSSFVQALTGVPLPQANSRCTTRPLEIRMRRSDDDFESKEEAHAETKAEEEADSYATVVVRAVPRDKEEEKSVLDGRQPVYFSVVEDDRRAIGLLQDVLEKLNGQGKPFTADSIVLEVSMPKQIALTIVDLPGLVDETANQEVTKIYDRFLKNENATVVALVPALSRDLQTNHTVSRYVAAGDRHREKLRKRMVGIIAQLDTIADTDIKRRCFELLAPTTGSANPHALPKGYFAIKCPGPGNSPTSGARPSAKYSNEEGLDFDSAEEMEQYYCDKWVAEYAGAKLTTVRLTETELRKRFGRNNVRQYLRQELIRLSREALRHLPNAVDARINVLQIQEAGYPTPQELAHRQKTVAGNFMAQVRRRIDEIRPSPTGVYHGLALLDDGTSVAEAIALWDTQLERAIGAIHVFLEGDLLQHHENVAQYFHNRLAADKRHFDDYSPKSSDTFKQATSASLSIARFDDQDVEAARAESAKKLTEWLVKRFGEAFAGFLEYRTFETFLKAVLVTAVDPIVGYIRKCASLCGLIYNKMIWEIEGFDGVSLCKGLEKHLHSKFERLFHKKMEHLIEAVGSELRRASLFRQQNLQATVREAALPHALTELKERIITAVVTATDQHLASPSGVTGADSLVEKQRAAVNATFSKWTGEPLLGVVERDANSYLTILERHWQSRERLLIENVRELVRAHLLGPSEDSFLEHLRQFGLSPGDEKFVDDDTAEIGYTIGAIKRELGSLTAAQATIQRFFE